MAYQRFDGTMSFLPSRFEAQAMLSEMQKKTDEEMKLLRLKQAEEQKHQTEALWSDLNRMLTELKTMTANREATMSKFVSQTSIPPRPPFPPPDPPDIRKSRQDLTIKAPDLPDFNQSELISTNQVPNKLTLRYSCEEIHERMTNGLCIFCEDLDTPGHYNLKHKRSKICLVECVDDRLPDEELVEPTVEEISNKSVTMIQDEESNSENESRPEFSHQVLFSQVQHTPTNQYRAPFNPCQNHSDKPHNKSKFGNCIGHEIESDKDSDEIEDDELQDKQIEQTVETLVKNEGEQPLDTTRHNNLFNEMAASLGIMEMGPIQEPESLGLTYSIFKGDFVPSQFQVPIPSLEPGRRYHKESLVVVNDLSYDHGCAIGKTIGSVCVSELGQANSHDEEEFKGLNFGKLLENERLLSIVFLLGLNDMSCWTQLLRQQIFPKSWRFKFKTESSGEAILLNTYRAVCLGVYNSSLEEKLELSGWKYKKQINQGHICLNGLCNELVCDEEKKRESIEFNECHNHLKKLQAAPEGIPQKIAGGLIYGVVKFHLKHKWRSKFGSSKLTRTWTNYSRYDSSSCVLQQEENYVMVLFPVAGTASIDELRSVCKLLFGIFVLNLITEQVHGWSFFGLLLQWKWHPPPQATSEFHQAHIDKSVFHL